MTRTFIIRIFMLLALLAAGPLASVAEACVDRHDVQMSDMHSGHDMMAMQEMPSHVGDCGGDCMETLACKHKADAAPVTLAPSPVMEKFILPVPVLMAFLTPPSPPYKTAVTARTPVPPNPSLHARSVSYLI